MKENRRADGRREGLLALSAICNQEALTSMAEHAMRLSSRVGDAFVARTCRALEENRTEARRASCMPGGME